jgi:hypothetical protein
MFLPGPASPELTSIGEIPPLPSAGSSSAVAFPMPAAAPPPQPASPAFKPIQRALLSDEPAISDTHSVRSGRSLSSSASSHMKHPDLHEAGLNASFIENVSAWFEQGNITKAMVIGQVGLAYNPVDISAGPVGSENIRLENFPVLEKVAPNPAFIEQMGDTPGTYTVDLSKIITKTQVAFHYQVHLDGSSLATFAPILLSPTWKSQPTQISVQLNYSLNPTFELGGATSVTLQNLVLLIRIEPGVKTTNCQSKPSGTFSREKGLIYWRLGDVTLSREQPAQTLRARFYTDSEAKPGNSEARWEITGVNALNIGSGLSISQTAALEAKQEGESDPFADDDENAPPASPAVGWKAVPSVKRFASGTYQGV